MMDKGFGRAGVTGETRDGIDAIEEIDFCGEGPIDLRLEKEGDCRASGFGDAGGVGSASTRLKL